MRNVPTPLVLLVALFLVALFVGDSKAPSAIAIEVEPVIWQLDEDYPEAIGPDVSLPISTVYIKTHDATDWMATYDNHPQAVSGPDSIRALIQRYATEGIEVAAWFVPKGLDFNRQVQMAVQVIDSGVKALYADLEPFAGFCNRDCNVLAEQFWYRVRAERPNAHLGVIYDPRTWWWEASATAKWLSVADSALPMCYWESYIGQVPWNDPAGCVSQAHADLAVLAPGRHLEYVPMLQGNTHAARFLQVCSQFQTLNRWRHENSSPRSGDHRALKLQTCRFSPIDSHGRPAPSRRNDVGVRSPPV